MGRVEDRRDRLVHSTLKTGWAKFGAPELDDATYEYISEVACSVMAEAMDAESGEIELLEQLGPLLRGQDLRDRQVATLCKAVARNAFAAKVATPSATSTSSTAARGDEVLCRCEDLILMYLGSNKFLLKDTTLELLRGRRYAIVGRNGAGKTTLMERIAGGAVDELLTSRLTLVHIRHETLTQRSDPKTRVLDYVRSEVGEDCCPDVALDEVGFTAQLKAKQLCQLSGGWRVRMLLATAAAQRADVLLLDEPTNHLDAEAVAWLVAYLTGEREATMMIVSHDAPFLNAVCTDVIHFDDCKLKYYAGNFQRFQEQAMLHGEEAEAVLQVRSAVAGPSHRSAGFSFVGQTPIPRIDAADKPERRGGGTSITPDQASAPQVAPVASASLRMHLPVPGKVEGVATTKKTVIELRDVSFKYPMAPDYALKHVSGKVTMSSRIGVVGPNGAGKSTLMALLCGEIGPSPDEHGNLGAVDRHRLLRLSYVAQDHCFHLAAYGRCTPVEYMQERFKNGYDEELQKRLNFPADEKEAAKLKLLAARYGKYSKTVEAVVSRVNRDKELRYEVKWQDLCERQNTFEPIVRLKQLGVERMATALDERLAAAGADDRPLTRREVLRHLEGFGLSEDVAATCCVGSLSGGQKSRLMIAAAFWTRPHIVCFDEPTNFMDFGTVAALGRALRGFRGGVVVISHNEEFVASFCSETWNVVDHSLASEVPRAEQRPAGSS